MKDAVNCQKLLEQGFAEVLVKALAKALAEEREEGYAAAYVENFAQGFIEGRVEEAQHNLLSLGTVLFGKPSAQVQRVLDPVTDIDVLEALLLRVVQVGSWTELLDDLRKGIPAISSPLLAGGATG